MLPQYAQRDRGAEIAVWLLITVGSLLIPIIIIAVCCIRRHLARRPEIKLMSKPYLRTKRHTTRTDVLRTYNGPYMESGNEDGDISSSEKNNTPTSSRSNSLKKQHVHWPDGSTTPKIQGFHSKKPYPSSNFSEDTIPNTMILTESPSTHRRPTAIPSSSAALSSLIQTAIMPAGSTVVHLGTSQFLPPSKEFTSTAADDNSIL